MKKSTGLVLILCMLVAVLFTGCGNADTADKEGAPASVEEKKLKVAMLLPDTINDQGWNAAAYNGLKRIEEKFDAKISYTEKVTQSDMEDIFRGYALEGYDVIIGHGFQYGDIAKKVAPDFKDVKFLITSSDISQEPNVSSLNMDTFQKGFMPGVVAALVTKTNKVAGVGGNDVPPNALGLKGFEKGAKYINPNIEVFTTLTGNNEDGAKAKETALAMIEKGADVVMPISGPAAIGVIEAAKEKGILAVGTNGDMNPLAPDTVVTSGIADLAVGMEMLIQKYVDNQLEAKAYNMGVAEGVVYLAPYHGFDTKLDPTVKGKIAQLVEDIKAGKVDFSALNK